MQNVQGNARSVPCFMHALDAARNSKRVDGSWIKTIFMKTDSYEKSSVIPRVRG